MAYEYSDDTGSDAPVVPKVMNVSVVESVVDEIADVDVLVGKEVDVKLPFVIDIDPLDDVADAMVVPFEGIDCAKVKTWV